jgi:flagellar basal body-associated protein FliL
MSKLKEEDETKQKSKSMSIVLIVLLVLVGIILIFVGIFAFKLIRESIRKNPCQTFLDKMACDITGKGRCTWIGSGFDICIDRPGK